MPDMEFVEHLKQERQEEQDYLNSLESGVDVGRKPTFGGPHSWQDRKQSEIDKSKRIIAKLDSLIAQYERADG